MQVVESSSLVSVLFREAFSHPYISFFHLLVNSFVVLVSVLFCEQLPFLVLVGGISERGGIKMVSASTSSANEPYFQEEFSIKSLQSSELLIFLLTQT